MDEQYNKDKNPKDIGVNHEKEFKWELSLLRYIKKALLGNHGTGSVAAVMVRQLLRDVGVGTINPINKPGDAFTGTIKWIKTHI